MKKQFIKLALLALAGMAFIGQSAKAATLVWNDGDLFLGFAKSGAANDYIVDVGQATQFTTTSSFTLSIGSTASDLSSGSLFGASWYGASSGVFWGAIGGLSQFDSVSGLNIIYAGNTSNTPYNDAFDLSSPFQSYNDMGFANYNGNTSTANSSVGYIQVSSSGNSWASNVGSAIGGSAIGNFQFTADNNFAGTTNQAIWLSTVTEGDTNPGTLLGYFTIGSNGTVTWTGSSAVPEPSTYALLAFGVIALVALRRFKAVKTA